MYISTPEVRARAIDGWSPLVAASTLTLEIDLDPACLSRSGQSTIRTWLRKGYASRLSGTLQSYWTGLMYMLNARYIMKDDGTSSFIRVFDQSIMDAVSNNDGHVAAMFKLIRAAHSEGTVDNGRSKVSMNVHSADDTHQSSTYTMSSRRWAGNVQFYGQEYYLMRDLFSQQFGPPVEVDEALAFFKTPHSMRLSIRQQDNSNARIPRRFTDCRAMPV